MNCYTRDDDSDDSYLMQQIVIWRRLYQFVYLVSNPFCLFNWQILLVPKTFKRQINGHHFF
jgi:hypothetical protein